MAKYEGRYENLEHIGVDHGLAEWIESLTLEWRHDYSANYEDTHATNATAGTKPADSSRVDCCA